MIGRPAWKPRRSRQKCLLTMANSSRTRRLSTRYLVPVLYAIKENHPILLVGKIR